VVGGVYGVSTLKKPFSFPFLPLRYLQLLLQDGLQSLLDGFHVAGGGHVVLAAGLAAGEGQILGHNAVDVNGVNAGLLEALSEGDDLRGAVEGTTLDETTGPGEDGGDGVGGGLVTLLVLAVVASDGSVSRLGLEGLSVGSDQDRGHQSEGAEALRHHVGLNVTVVVCVQSVKKKFVRPRLRSGFRVSGNRGQRDRK